MTGVATELVDRLRWLLGRGARHRERLADVETTVVVSGSRGKSSAVEYLAECFEARGYDVLAKVTGNRPVCIRDGERHPIDRDGSVRLYENERELRRHGQPEVLILENQAIGDYTNWVFNRYFADPDLVVFTNVRQDHRDTLGRERSAIARSLARSVPSGTTVVSGEQDAAIRSVLGTELARRDCPTIHATVPDSRATIPGAEVVYAADAVLEAVTDRPMARDRLDGYLSEMDVEWTALPDGRVFDAASVNDVESTEAIRRSLARQDAPVVHPVLYVRRDRRARTEAFLEYLGTLHDRGAIESARVVGEHTAAFARFADYPVVEHSPEEAAEDVLDAALATGYPVVLMGNTVASFMRDVERTVETRSRVEAVVSTDRSDATETTAPEEPADGPPGSPGPIERTNAD